MRLHTFIDETVPSLMRLDGRNWYQHRRGSGEASLRPYPSKSLVVPGPEEVNVRRGAKTHRVQVGRRGGARDNLPNEPKRHATDCRICDVYELMVLAKPKTRLVLLTFALEKSGRGTGETAHLAFCQTDSPVILRVPALNAIGGEIAKGGYECIAVQDYTAEINRAPRTSARHHSLELNQFVNNGYLEIGRRCDQPLAVFR